MLFSSDDEKGVDASIRAGHDAATAPKAIQ
jgi:hypothetical protein